MRKPSAPAPLLRLLARQLGGPSGPIGSLVARMLNKGNGAAIRGAVDALALGGGETVADVGFGGGVGLALLLDATGATGRVHGVEPSTDMLARARRAYADPVAAGRLQLHEASMDALPLPDDALDGWITINTIYFVADLDAGARDLARVLAPTGRGVVGIGDPDWMASLPFTRHGFRLRAVADVVATLGSAGLEVEHRPLLGEDGPPFHLLICRHAR